MLETTVVTLSVVVKTLSGVLDTIVIILVGRHYSYFQGLWTLSSSSGRKTPSLSFSFHKCLEYLLSPLLTSSDLNLGFNDKFYKAIEQPVPSPPQKGNEMRI